MRVVEERKIYNFAEGSTAKKWADSEEIDGTVTWHASGETLKQSLSWNRISTLSSSPIRTKSSRIIQECYLNKIASKTCKKNRSKEEEKIKNINHRKIQENPAVLQQPARIMISLTSDRLFVLGFLYVLQETWSEMLALEWAKTHTGVQRNKFQN